MRRTLFRTFVTMPNPATEKQIADAIRVDLQAEGRTDLLDWLEQNEDRFYKMISHEYTEALASELKEHSYPRALYGHTSPETAYFIPDYPGRSLPHLLQVLDQLASNGVGFAAIRDAGIDTTTPTGRLLLQLLGAFADYERSLLRERVLAGVRRAQASGKHCGRPRKELDLRPALALLNEGRGLKDVARILKVPRATLRRRLDEAGRWPVGRQAA